MNRRKCLPELVRSMQVARARVIILSNPFSAEIPLINTREVKTSKMQLFFNFGFKFPI